MNRQILEEASAWFIEFRADSRSPTSHAEFVQWLTRSPEHIRAYLEISGTYTQAAEAWRHPRGRRVGSTEPRACACAGRRHDAP